MYQLHIMALNPWSMRSDEKYPSGFQLKLKLLKLQMHKSVNDNNSIVFSNDLWEIEIIIVDGSGSFSLSSPFWQGTYNS